MDQQNSAAPSDEPPSPPRAPKGESTDLYDGLCVCDGRVSGSVTVSRSRLPLWAFVGLLPIEGEGWAGALDGWPYIEEGYGWTAEHMSHFLYYLTLPRKEFGRLLLVLADAERHGNMGAGTAPWIEQPEQRWWVREQLLRCLDALDRFERAEEAR
jgi:hypothetical protein